MASVKPVVAHSTLPADVASRVKSWVRRNGLDYKTVMANAFDVGLHALVAQVAREGDEAEQARLAAEDEKLKTQEADAENRLRSVQARRRELEAKRLQLTPVQEDEEAAPPLPGTVQLTTEPPWAESTESEASQQHAAAVAADLDVVRTVGQVEAPEVENESQLKETLGGLMKRNG